MVVDDRILTGANHLANVLIGKLGGDFAKKYPPDMDAESALRRLGATVEYDVWCCWAAIMRTRDDASPSAVCAVAESEILTRRPL